MLSLHNTCIGSVGTQYIAKALQQNKVTLHSHLLILLFIVLITKTLTSIHLSRNKICSGGAQHLANALEQNNVI